MQSCAANAHLLVESSNSPHQTLSWLQQQHSASDTPSLSNSAWYKQCCTCISACLADKAAGCFCAQEMRTRCLLNAAVHDVLPLQVHASTNANTQSNLICTGLLFSQCVLTYVWPDNTR